MDDVLERAATAWIDIPPLHVLTLCILLYRYDKRSLMIKLVFLQKPHFPGGRCSQSGSVLIDWL